MSSTNVAKPTRDVEHDALMAKVERLTKDLYAATNPPFTGKIDTWQAACGKARRERDDALAEVERLRALSVEHILLSVSPGWDGMGHEIYAKSVADVQHVLSDQGLQIEDQESVITGELAKVQELLEVLRALMDGPYDIDEATVSEKGLDHTMQVAPNQVVGLMIVALVKHRAARAAIAKYGSAK